MNVSNLLLSSSTSLVLPVYTYNTVYPVIVFNGPTLTYGRILIYIMYITLNTGISINVLIYLN